MATAAQGRCRECGYWRRTTLRTESGEPVYDCILSEDAWCDENDPFCERAEARASSGPDKSGNPCAAGSRKGGLV